jgi:hypothetical protein
MDLGLLVQLISGIAGGNLAGSLLKARSLGIPGNSLAGFVGGGLGGQIVTTMLGLGAMDGADLNLGSLAAQAAGAGIGGALLATLVGMLKKTFAK